jgi:hypothetical protein
MVGHAGKFAKILVMPIITALLKAFGLGGRGRLIRLSEEGTAMNALTRREMILLLWTLGGVLAVPYMPYAWATNSVKTQSGSEIIPFLWEGSLDELNMLKDRFGIQGSLKQQDVRNPLVYVLAGTLLLREFSNIVHTIQCQMRKSVVIDTRGEKIKTEIDPNLFPGTVTIIGRDGTEIKTCDQLTNSSLLVNLLAEAWAKKK